MPRIDESLATVTSCDLGLRSIDLVSLRAETCGRVGFRRLCEFLERNVYEGRAVVIDAELESYATAYDRRAALDEVRAISNLCGSVAGSNVFRVREQGVKELLGCEKDGIFVGPFAVGARIRHMAGNVPNEVYGDMPTVESFKPYEHLWNGSVDHGRLHGFWGDVGDVLFSPTRIMDAMQHGLLGSAVAAFHKEWLLHGDLHAENIRVTDSLGGPAIRVNDWHQARCLFREPRSLEAATDFLPFLGGLTEDRWRLFRWFYGSGGPRGRQVINLMELGDELRAEVYELPELALEVLRDELDHLSVHGRPEAQVQLDIAGCLGPEEGLQMALAWGERALASSATLARVLVSRATVAEVLRRNGRFEEARAWLEPLRGGLEEVPAVAWRLAHGAMQVLKKCFEAGGQEKCAEAVETELKELSFRRGFGWSERPPVNLG